MDLLLKPVPNKDAIAFLRDKPPLARGVFDRLLPEIQARTFTVAGIESVKTLQSLRDRIADLPAGGDWDAIKGDLVNDISPYLGEGEEALAAATRKAELLLRTHGYQAYSATRYVVDQETKDTHPYRVYATSQDDTVRSSHAALDGLVLPVDDPFWETHMPPGWDWGCRCDSYVISRSRAGEIAAEDEKLPPEARRILTPQQRETMNRSGFLVRGPNINVDVRGPRDRGRPSPSGPPGDLRLPLDEIKKRYDAPTWAAFESFAQGQQLGDGRTVWGWLLGEAVPGAASTTVQTVSAAVVAARTAILVEDVAAAKPNAAPVSDAIDIKAKGPVRLAVKRSLELIDKAHDDGVLPMIPVSSAAGKAYGVYVHKLGGAPARIGVSSKAPHKLNTAAHELGHFIDHQALGSPGRFASESSPLLADWRTVAMDSAPLKAIEEQIGKGGVIRDYFEYLARPRETWARAYAQFIATRTGDAAMLAELATMRALPKVGPMLVWSAEEFAPIAREIEAAFKAKGWIK